LGDAARAAGPPLLFELRLWASVCLALYVAFWLELDNASWAGTSAALVCQPLLGASLRKGWFRMIGTAWPNGASGHYLCSDFGHHLRAGSRCGRQPSAVILIILSVR
jgi:hypothetical protein